MRLPPQEAVLLRIFLGEDDRAGGRPLYEALIMKARETGMAGATVLRGPMGFGHGARLHTTKILQLSTDLPMIVEIVDSQQKIDAFLEAIEPMIGSGLVTLEKATIIRYGNSRISASVNVARSGRLPPLLERRNMRPRQRRRSTICGSWCTWRPRTTHRPSARSDRR